ncbi:alpha-D-ribose 1-methylphosphonate 5-triphosphate diphosphatase [Rhodoligotrophos appendicifer]|uniref:alpha-D-ribose 1-methylphosphonate 5-triphosphate diphosphatase n=1 Tax=Rhodoligotrophos appendicifer TaxID=987056 RepID=UPI00117C7DDA|nr:alpha-D-ribose 1-methylphosphonate 5-triphosphate diphosphatase [Rhodoligotrophos appendicifer]
MPETVFTNARIVMRDEVIEGSLAISGAEIKDVSAGRVRSTSAIDCEGDLLVPGLVELHTDNLERHMMPRPKASWPAGSAAINHDREIIAAGITTVYNALTIGHVRPTSTAEGLGAMLSALDRQAASGALKAEHRLHLRCEVSGSDLMDLLEPLIDHPSVGLMSVMDHTPGQRQFVSLEQYTTYYQGKYALTDEALRRFIIERREDFERYGVAQRRKVVDMARERGLPLASHDDATFDHVAEAANDSVVIAEFPTTIEAAQACRTHDLAVLMGAPNVVRGGSHSGNVAARELARLGCLDILSSDYVPASLLFGALMLTEGEDGIALPQAIGMVTTVPARRLGLDDRGEIAAGKRADLVRFRPDAAGPVVREVWREGERVA